MATLANYRNSWLLLSFSSQTCLLHLQNTTATYNFFPQLIPCSPPQYSSQESSPMGSAIRSEGSITSSPKGLLAIPTYPEAWTHISQNTWFWCSDLHWAPISQATCSSSDFHTHLSNLPNNPALCAVLVGKGQYVPLQNWVSHKDPCGFLDGSPYT